MGAVTYLMGSRDDFYDNALAVTVNGRYKTELIRRQGRGGRPTRLSARRRGGMGLVA